MEKNTVLLRNRMSLGTLGQACGVLAAPVVASFSLMLVPTTGVRGQDPTVKAYADPPEVAVGEQFRLVVEVGGAGTVESVTVPERFDFVQGSGRSEPTVAIKVASGEDPGSPNAFTLTYVLVAREPGFLEVGPFRIIADGRSLETEPVGVLVERQSFSAVVVKTRVEPSRIHVGDRFTLTAEIFGPRSWTHEFIPPDVFDVSNSMSTSGMRSDTHRSWRLQAAEPGEFVIPPVQVVAGDLTYESEPVTLVIEPPRVQVETTLESGSIWVGGEFDFQLEVTGVSELDEEPAVPGTEAFAELVGVEKSSYDFREGHVERLYGFRAVQAGEFEIGPVRIVANGRTFESQRTSLVVDEVPTGDTDSPKGVFLQVLPDKTRAYVNEPVVVVYAVAHDDRSMGPMIGTKSWPSFEDFDVLELGHGWFDREVVVDGRRYRRSLVRRVALRPRRAGQLDLGTTVVEAGLWGVEARGREETSMILTSEPHTLEVLALPDEGRPASFKGHVGTLEVVSWMDRTRAEVGETITLQVEVSVEGLVEGLPDPEIEFPRGFAVSEPDISGEGYYRRDGMGGTRTYTCLLTAVTPGSHVVPAVEMSYFHAETGSYGTTRSHPFTVTVVPAGAEGR